MNKITQKLLGTASALALVAGCGAAPAFAGGFFQDKSTPGVGTFSFTNSSPSTATFSLTNAPAKFVDGIAGDPVLTGTFSLTSSMAGYEAGSTKYIFDNTTLNFVSGNKTITETGKTKVTFTGGFATLTNFTKFAGSGYSNDGFRLGKFAPAPVPEASTVVSFGALLALGGLAVLRRKSVKTAA